MLHIFVISGTCLNEALPFLHKMTEKGWRERVWEMKLLLSVYIFWTTFLVSLPFPLLPHTTDLCTRGVHHLFLFEVTLCSPPKWSSCLKYSTLIVSNISSWNVKSVKIHKRVVNQGQFNAFKLYWQFVWMYGFILIFTYCKCVLSVPSCKGFALYNYLGCLFWTS